MCSSTCGVIATYTCDIFEKIEEIGSRNKLMQFLMGLTAGYENVRKQILAIDTYLQ